MRPMSKKREPIEETWKELSEWVDKILSQKLKPPSSENGEPNQ